MLEYWYLWILLVLICMIALFAISKANKAANKRKEKTNAIIKEIEKEKYLREKYRFITKHQIINEPIEELIEGITASIQESIEKEVEIKKAFDELPIVKQEIYALNYFLEDAKERLSHFFHNNGNPLPSLAVEAIEKITKDNRLKSIVNEMYNMYDEDKDASFDNDRIEEFDAEFKERFERDHFLTHARQYVLENAEVFS